MSWVRDEMERYHQLLKSDADFAKNFRPDWSKLSNEILENVNEYNREIGDLDEQVSYRATGGHTITVERNGRSERAEIRYKWHERQLRVDYYDLDEVNSIVVFVEAETGSPTTFKISTGSLAHNIESLARLILMPVLFPRLETPKSKSTR